MKRVASTAVTAFGCIVALIFILGFISFFYFASIDPILTDGSWNGVPMMVMVFGVILVVVIASRRVKDPTRPLQFYATKRRKLSYWLTFSGWMIFWLLLYAHVGYGESAATVLIRAGEIVTGKVNPGLPLIIIVLGLLFAAWTCEIFLDAGVKRLALIFLAVLLASWAGLGALMLGHIQLGEAKPAKLAHLCTAHDAALLVMNQYLRSGPIGVVDTTFAGKPATIIIVSGTNFRADQDTNIFADVDAVLALDSRYRDDLLAALHGTLHDNVILIGHSLGGMVTYLATTDDRLKALNIHAISFGSPEIEPLIDLLSTDSDERYSGTNGGHLVVNTFRDFWDPVPLMSAADWVHMASGSSASSTRVIDIPWRKPVAYLDDPQRDAGRYWLLSLPMAPVWPWAPYALIHGHFAYPNSADLQNFSATGEPLTTRSANACLPIDQNTIRDFGRR